MVIGADFFLVRGEFCDYSQILARTQRLKFEGRKVGKPRGLSELIVEKIREFNRDGSRK